MIAKLWFDGPSGRWNLQKEQVAEPEKVLEIPEGTIILKSIIEGASGYLMVEIHE